MQLRYNFRIDPTPGQVTRLARAFGCARVVYNDALRARKDARVRGLAFPKTADLSRVLITEAKRTPERAWLSEVSSVVLQQSLRDLDAAYKNLFDSLGGERKGARVLEPRFKSRKDGRQAVRFTANARFKVAAGRKLFLPKIGEVRVRWSRELPSEPSSVTVVRDASGRYHASFVVETDPVEDAAWFPFDPGTEYAETGIDLGLAYFAVLSDGRKVESPKFLQCARHGRYFGKVGRFVPTSQTCSRCGVIDGPKPLSVREWTCPGCGAVHDRDVCAAENVLAAGQADRENACRARVRPGLVPARRDEAGTRRSDRAARGTRSSAQ